MKDNRFNDLQDRDPINNLIMIILGIVSTVGLSVLAIITL
jgi:hypothetical protein